MVKDYTSHLTPEQETPKSKCCVQTIPFDSEIQDAIAQDDTIFQNIIPVSLSTIDKILNRCIMPIKQLHMVASELNNKRVKELRYLVSTFTSFEVK